MTSAPADHDANAALARASTTGPAPLPDFRLLFESAPGLYLVLGPDLRILAVSEAYLQATKTQRSAILGLDIFEVFPDNPDDAQASGERNLHGSLLRVLETGKKDALPIQKYDIRLPESEGGGFEERYWSALNSPIFDAQGRLTYIIHRVEDVTEFMRARQRGKEQERIAQSLREQTERMESEIYSRAQEVAEFNERLRLANAELERLYVRTKELDELKTQLFANVSHELRTPLQLVIAPVEKLLGGDTLDPSAREQLDIVLRNARLLLRRVNDLLDAARLDAGQMTVRYVETDLAQWVRMTTGYFANIAQQQDLRFVVEAGELQKAQFDPEKVQRILYNLLSNAFKFAPAGGCVRCTLRPGADGESAVIEVADSGAGVKPEHRALIFERFRQADGGATRRHGGTGLGLAIARDFARLHRGDLVVGDAPEGGALFVLSLPLRAPAGEALHADAFASESALEHAASAELREETHTPAAPAGERHDGASILVVEDNVDLNRLICASLQPYYRVQGVFDGESGLAAALAATPDLIVTDVMMPGMSGDALLREVRSRDRFDGIPVIVLSARADDASRVQLLRDGAQDYIVKPFSVDELLARVRGQIQYKLAREHGERLYQALQERQQATQVLSERLQTTNQELESFSYSVSHDLRAPLRAIDGFARLLEQRAETRLDDEDRRLLKVVRNNSKAMGRLIDDLLQFSKMSRSEIHLADVDMTELVRTAWDAVSDDYAGEITIGELPRAYVDRALFRQVWLNLLSNAVKYTSRTPAPRVGISGECHGGEIHYHVIDNGAGFDMDYAHKLFGVFQRLHGADEFEGSGIGLAIVARVVARHGGRVSAEGKAGAGARFHITLPLSNQAS